jgi:hypothetical protein
MNAFPALTEEESKWVGEFAGRLRLIHADAATAGVEKRREYLQDEIGRGLKDVPEANRKRYLSALLDRFPVAGKILEATMRQPAPIVESKTEPIPETPEQILERFVHSIQALPQEKRRNFATTLREAALIPVAEPTNAAVMEVAPEVQRALGLPPDRQPRLDRLAQLAAQLIELCATLDQTALKSLNQLSARSALLKRTEDVRRSAARFLVGETDSVDPQLRAMTALLGALLAAMLGGGKEFGREYLQRFSPGAIEEGVGDGSGKLGGMFGPTKKERCWDKYTDLSNDFATPDLIDRRIKECMAAFVEKTARGGR